MQKCRPVSLYLALLHEIRASENAKHTHAQTHTEYVISKHIHIYSRINMKMEVRAGRRGTPPKMRAFGKGCVWGEWLYYTRRASRTINHRPQSGVKVGV